eukprot:20637-Heterococcus_DN1.PRE.4
MQPGSEDLAILAEIIAQVDDVFMVIVVGEFNSGKSTFINALLGDRYVAEGVLPTTASINILRKSEPGVTEVLTRPYKDPLASSSRSSLATSATTSLDGVQEIRVPVAWLDSVALVRT